MVLSTPSSSLFWDSCVFVAFLKDERSSYNVWLRTRSMSRR